MPASLAAAHDKTREFLGHPRGLTFLFSTEMWERFSYYGMRSLLVLYMTKYLLNPEHARVAVGYAAVKGALESVFGPLGTQPLASQIYGLYTGFVYLTPIFGGMIADRALGQRRTVIIGATLMAFGHFMMAFESLFFLALLMLILGNGAFKPNISSQVGRLYAPDDSRRDRAFSIFYIGINLGAFFSPLVCGTLGEQVGWHYGFMAAGIGMVTGLVIYLCSLPTLPPDDLPRRRAAAGRRRKLDPGEWRIVIALVVLCVPSTFFWATYEQSGNTVVLWANDFTDRSINLLVWSGEIPTTWFQAFNPFMIFAFTPLVVALWAGQATRRTEPPTLTKMALGCLLLAAGYAILAIAAALTADRASWLWLFAFFVVMTIGELYLSPTGLSLVTRAAPAAVLSTLMGLWLLTNFTGNLIAGWLGSYWTSMSKASFFLMIAAIAAVAGGAIFACGRPLDPILGDRN